MKVSFLILAYKSTAHTRVCISHLQELELPFEHEIICVDNASKNRLAEEIPAQFPNITFIENEKNLGHPAGNNVGINIAKGEYVVLLNPDVIINSAQEVIDMVAYMDEHKKIGILGPRMYSPDGQVQPTCYEPYTRLTPIYRRTFLGKTPWGKKDINRHLMSDFDHNETRSVPWLQGSCMFVRKTAIDDAGPMDADFFLYLGDYEWCDRMRQHGWDVVYYHDTNHIIHYHRRESADRRFALTQVVSYATRVHIRDWLIFLKKQRNGKST